MEQSRVPCQGCSSIGRVFVGFPVCFGKVLLLLDELSKTSTSGTGPLIKIQTPFSTPRNRMLAVGTVGRRYLNLQLNPKF